MTPRKGVDSAGATGVSRGRRPGSGATEPRGHGGDWARPPPQDDDRGSGGRRGPAPTARRPPATQRWWSGSPRAARLSPPPASPRSMPPRRSPRPSADVVAAELAVDHARSADLVVAVTEGLKVGDPCPVCNEPLTALAAGVRQRAGKTRKAWTPPWRPEPRRGAARRRVPAPRPAPRRCSKSSTRTTTGLAKLGLAAVDPPGS